MIEAERVTYLRTGEGWLCAVLDGRSRRVIGRALGEHLCADRDRQYTSAQLARFANRHNLTRSLGRTAVCLLTD